MKLSIIVLNYKKPDLTMNCLTSLFKQFGKEFSEDIFEVIIVDNASGDESVRVLKEAIQTKKYKNIKLIVNSENSGFSKGCNLGAKDATGKYILFLNNDTTVKDKGILKMTEYMKINPEVSILGGQLKKPNGENQPSAGKFYSLFNTFLLLIGMQKFGISDKNPKNISEVDWVKGALFMIRKDIFEKLSGFDEKIFMYTEDMEFCYRAKKQGFKTYFYPDVSIIHEDQGSSSRSFAIVQIYKGLLYFYKKHKSFLEYSIVKTMLYVKAVTAIGIGSLTGNKYLITTFRKAMQF